jgi:pyruvate kinase
MQKYTKIIATVSDKRCDVDFIRSLYLAGMNVVRLNTAHLDEKGLETIVCNTREVSGRIGIIIDTKGPEIRTNRVNEPILFKTGERVKLKGDAGKEATRDCITVSYPDIVNDLAVGNDILIDDGDLELKVVEKQADYLVCEIQNNAALGGNKSLNVPGVCINLPSLSEKDRKNIDWAITNDLDFIAHSFVRSKQDVLDIQQLLDERDSPIKIIAKIENQEGVDHIDEILEVAYGIMIARGDLGIEIPAEKIPALQRYLIRKCVEAKKPVIVATQMLHSMITNPRPTRAEVTDIAHAIYDRTDALMLSGETAIGKYPVEAVQIMTKVICEAEGTKLKINDIRVPIEGDDLDVTSYLAKQAVKSSSKLHVKAIITDSHSGRTARYLAAFRGTSTVFAICYNEQVMRMLSLSFGVWAVYQPWNDNRREYFFDALHQLLDSGQIVATDQVAYLGGSFGRKGGTTFLEINEVNRIFSPDEKFELPTFAT